jgi:hypothetical protein
VDGRCAGEQRYQEEACRTLSKLTGPPSIVVGTLRATRVNVRRNRSHWRVLPRIRHGVEHACEQSFQRLADAVFGCPIFGSPLRGAGSLG